MKYNFNEYEKMVIQLNLNKSKKVMWVIIILMIAISLLIGFLLGNDVYFNVFVALFASCIGVYIYRKSISDSAKQVNLINTIVSVEQEIYEDKILEKVVRTGNIENCGEYYYKDVISVKSDKYNFYLYLSNNSAIIVNKGKLDNIEEFRKILRANKLIK